MTKQKEFSPKMYSSISLNTSKKYVLTPIFMNCDSFYCLFTYKYYKSIKY